MKLIMAIIKPNKLDAVREALTEISFQGLTASEVSGSGRQKGHTDIYRGAEYAIRNAANTEHIGDGKIFILDVAQAIRVRTGETGVEAL